MEKKSIIEWVIALVVGLLLVLGMSSAAELPTIVNLIVAIVYMAVLFVILIQFISKYLHGVVAIICTAVITFFVTAGIYWFLGVGTDKAGFMHVVANVVVFAITVFLIKGCIKFIKTKES